LAETATLPSVTSIGAVGDLVAYGGGLYYMSWYPACMIITPTRWRRQSGAEPDSHAGEIVTESFAALGAIVPDLQSVRPQDVSVRAGVIVAWGSPIS
jgi:hypothetical protein